MITKTQATRAVEAAFREMAQAYSDRDEVRLRGVLGRDLFFYGTGPDEVARSADQLVEIARRDWAQTDGTTFGPRKIRAHANGNVGWCDADADFDVVAGGRLMHFDARATAVFHKEGGRWRMVQGHVSLPAAGQATGQAFPQPRSVASGQTLVH